MRHATLLYDEKEDQRVQCQLCAHRCKISPGRRGICQVRENVEGQLFTLVYGNLIAQHVDPIEKKPLYHFHPGARAYSIALPGCNFRCQWCQNWQISQMPRTMTLPDVKRVAPEAVVQEAIQTGCEVIAYTYTEPTIFFEYSLDTARLAHQHGLKNVFVTNGYMTPEMLAEIGPFLDAANVDIKAFKDDTYRTLMGGRLAPVLESCRQMKARGIWLEITTLIVPDVNDGEDELSQIARFIYQDLGPETPWHLSRFFPQYQMQDRPVTSGSVLVQTRENAQKLGLNYIYLGNVSGEVHTHCKSCGERLIARNRYVVRNTGLDQHGRCQNCGKPLDGGGFADFGRT